MILQLSFNEANVLDAMLTDDIDSLKDVKDPDWLIAQGIQKKLRGESQLAP